MSLTTQIFFSIKYVTATIFALIVFDNLQIISLLLELLFLVLIYHFIFFYETKKRHNHLLAKELTSERERISKDLHDDLGSGLSAINLLSKYLVSKQEGAISNYKNEILKISETSESLNHSIREIVWSIEEKAEDVFSLLQFFKRYFHETFINIPIELHVNVTPNAKDVKLSGHLKKQILLCLKECTNNSIKHAQASIIIIDVQKNNDGFVNINFQDNGKGFEESNNSEGFVKGNGLQNINQRIQVLGGVTKITSTNAGTGISFQIPIQD